MSSPSVSLDNSGTFGVSLSGVNYICTANIILNYIVSKLTLTEYHNNIITSKLVMKKSPISTHIE